MALQPLVDEAFQRMAGAATARGIALKGDGLDRLVLYADPGLVSRVIDNVVANAVHYNRREGSVLVRATVEEPEPGAWATPMVLIAVTDTGHGIPEGEYERIFERFYRLDQSRARHTGGSGLGLALCREVVLLHGGTIGVGASSAAGTTIEIRLPGRRMSLGARTAAPETMDGSDVAAAWSRPR